MGIHSFCKMKDINDAETTVASDATVASVAIGGVPTAEALATDGYVLSRLPVLVLL
jgi:hypothetical protein